jgi:phytoene synthase
MYAIYAFCRIVDDIADDAGPFVSKLPLLDGWRRRIEGLYRGRSDEPVTRVLVRAVPRFALRQVDFLAIIDGMQMDAEQAIVAPDLATLDLYCDRVAAAVGRLSVRAFGDSSPSADQVAHALGRALQLTNILRDLHEDGERGRLYLPREWLDQAAVPHAPKAALAHSGLASVCERVVAAARGHFDTASQTLRACDQRAMRPARLMGATYAAILARVQRRGWQRLDQPVKLPKWQKLWIALRYAAG